MGKVNIGVVFATTIMTFLFSIQCVKKWLKGVLVLACPQFRSYSSNLLIFEKVQYRINVNKP